MQLPYVKSMYAEHTDEHFKLYCPIPEESMFINIYVNKNKDNGDIPLIFNGLYHKYLKQGMSKKDAVKKAKETVEDFFDICHELSKQLKRPFKLRIIPIDKKRIKSK